MDGSCRESISRSVSGELRRHLGDVFRELAVQKESKMGAGHLMPDHVHMMISKCGLAGDRIRQGQECDPPCSRLWQRNREQEDLRLDQMNPWR
jgi:hypothetical protein